MRVRPDVFGTMTTTRLARSEAWTRNVTTRPAPWGTITASADGASKRVAAAGATYIFWKTSDATVWGRSENGITARRGAGTGAPVSIAQRPLLATWSSMKTTLRRCGCQVL